MKYRWQAAALSDAAVGLTPEARTAAMLVLLGTTDERYEEWVASGVIKSCSMTIRTQSPYGATKKYKYNAMYASFV